MSGIEGAKGGVHDQKPHVVDSPIPECFKPDPKLAKTTMDGRVTYEDVNYNFLTGEEMRRVGEKVAKVFPSFTVWVTGGPWKGYDVKHQIDLKTKIISIDFYSPRPGLQHIPDIIQAIKGHLKERGVAP